MVPNIKKILYPTDLSDNAKHAFRYAADLALKYDAMITILYVMEDMNYTVEFQVRGMLGAKEWDRVKAE
ncbi:MAG: universal stress protein, partial [Proteobacteria bacterium]|nr:universal stress protein [Pseudomonadota bacterium]